MTMTKDELCRGIDALAAEHGHQWKKISDALNASGVTTLKGQPWSDQNVKRFYDRNCGVGHQKATQTLPEDPYVLPRWLDEESWNELRAMLEWWRAREHEPVQITGNRPVFRNKKRNSGVHCDPVILERAIAKARREKAITGGSLSLVVERLLWEWLGKPEDVLEPLPEEES